MDSNISNGIPTGALYGVVMAGGSGTRFWPESTSKRPKQYLSFVKSSDLEKSDSVSDSLLAQALKRFGAGVPVSHRRVVTVREQVDCVLEHSQGILPNDGIYFEPCGRNTAPCLLLTLCQLRNEGAGDEDIMILVPADHVILNTQGFQKTLRTAVSVAAQSDGLVTIGIRPHFPHTGYGYIKVGKEQKDRPCFKVESFVEKPQLEKAQSYLAAGNYYWNVGIFVGKLGSFWQEMAQHSPQIFQYARPLLEALKEKRPELQKQKVEKIYQQIPADSIDYAIMEKSSKNQLVPAEFDWNDLGSWDALIDIYEKKQGNCIPHDNKIYIENAQNNTVWAKKEQMVALIGVKDLIVVNCDKVLMVLPRQDAQKVKNIVQFLKEKDELELL
jgi:mannose-1-phosphate guanylyltransferase